MKNQKYTERKQKAKLQEKAKRSRKSESFTRKEEEKKSCDLFLVVL